MVLKILDRMQFQKWSPRFLRGFGRLTGPVWAAALMVALIAISEGYRGDTALPAVMDLTRPGGRGRAIDVRLDFRDIQLVDGVPLKGALTVINPSFAVRSEKLVLAARLHAMETVVTEGVQWQNLTVTELSTVWYSAVVVGESAGAYAGLSSWNHRDWRLDDIALQNLRLVADASAPSSSLWWDPHLRLCQADPVYVPSNNTLLRTVVTSAEDPKVLTHGPGGSQGLTLAFNSLAPPDLADARSQCRLHGEGKGVQQMFLASWEGEQAAAAGGPGAKAKGEGPLDLHAASKHGVRLSCGEFDKSEKNWIGFTYGDQLLYVYSVYPHRVVQVREEDGACHMVGAWTTAYGPFLEATIEADAEIHGSGTATLMRDPRTGEARYVALLHFLTRGEHVYTTMAYTFESRPPFAVTAVSRPLPLQGSTRAFASGLLVLPEHDKVVISYGVANEEARALVMQTDEFLSYFECQAS